MVSGCAAPVYEHRYRFSDGWREGVVEKIGNDEIMERWYAQSCSDIAVPPANKYVRFRWRQVGGSRFWILPLPESSQLRVGDAVYVNF